MVGRILTCLKKRGLIHDPPRTLKMSAKQGKSAHLPSACSNTKTIQAPGGLVEIEMLDVSLVPGRHFKHFTARDVVSRWEILQAYKRATAANAKQFLKTIQQRMPFLLQDTSERGQSV
jgi:putative transposase